MITLKNVSKWYGHFQVLTDCSTEVKKGEVVVVCGPSGSGKSTLIKTVNGLEPVQQGVITVDGTVVNDKKTDLAKLRSRVGMVFQHFELFPHLSIIENLTLAQVKVLKRDKKPARDKAQKVTGARWSVSACREVSSPALRGPATACRHRPGAVHGSYRHAI
ncbi:glutamate/aspartate ABC transporter ATP-binding protein [Citrobacter freundii]|nr:glutamate/aspartate ABC transporter ATP-binding protein [Citrobacter freundii]